eukprot:m.246035 g.246035  ORF g.246035 m.246035 type:complete len:468 (-) comp40654_c0_seq1:22-1425(-)
MSLEHVPLLASDSPPLRNCLQNYKFTHGAFWVRIAPWYTLIIFFLLTTFQTTFWFTFSSVPDTVTAYYPGMTDDDLDLLLNWGPIIFVPVVPVVSWYLTRPSGLAHAMLLGAALCALSCALRLVPCFLSESARSNTHVWLFLHFGQILNAAAGPIVMAAPSLLSATWFAVEQRTTATAVAYLGGNLGSAVGFLLGPYLADEPAHVPLLLWVTLALSLVPLLALMAWCPDKPRHAGADTAAPLTLRASLKQYGRDLVRTVTNMSLVILSALGGAQAGIASAWSGVLPQILAPPTYSSVFSGWCGCAYSIAGVIGNASAGLVGDKFFVGRLKILLVLSYFFSALFFLLFALSTCNPYTDPPLLPSAPALMVILLVAAGFFQSACDPLFYEMAAEISYPMPEGTSAGFIALLFNVATLVMLFVAPVIAMNLVNTIMTLTMLLGGLGTWFLVKEAYHRLKADTRSDLHVSS